MNINFERRSVIWTPSTLCFFKKKNNNNCISDFQHLHERLLNGMGNLSLQPQFLVQRKDSVTAMDYPVRMSTAFQASRMTAQTALMLYLITTSRPLPWKNKRCSYLVQTQQRHVPTSNLLLTKCSECMRFTAMQQCQCPPSLNIQICPLSSLEQSN